MEFVAAHDSEGRAFARGVVAAWLLRPNNRTQVSTPHTSDQMPSCDAAASVSVLQYTTGFGYALYPIAWTMGGREPACHMTRSQQD
jgi:hypothetical protein